MIRRESRRLRAAVLIGVVLLGTGVSRADVSEIRSQLESILAEADASRPMPPAVASQLDGLRSAAAEEVRSLLPLGLRCLTSSKPAARAYGMALFMVVTMRSDSTGLLEPYIDTIAPFLDDPEPGIRNVAIFVLGSSSPEPTSRGLTHLAAHLYSKSNSVDQARMIAAALLKARPADPATVHSVLQLLQERPALKIDLIQTIGVYRITTDEALLLIRDGLNESSAETRRISVDAVDRLPKEIRARFTLDLQRRITDPNETAEVRSRAQQVLVK